MRYLIFIYVISEDTVAISTDDFLLTLSEIIPLSVGLAIATCFIIISFITMICCWLVSNNNNYCTFIIDTTF